MSKPVLSGVSVLCIDNYIDALELLRMTLQFEGAQVSTAVSADEALFVWKRTAIDVVVCDLVMPKENGIEILKKLRSAGFGGPAIAVTGLSDPQVEAHALAHGFSQYLIKPVDNDRLIDVLVTVATGRAANSSAA